MAVLSTQWYEWKQTLWNALQIRPTGYHIMDTTPQGDLKWKGPQNISMWGAVIERGLVPWHMSCKWCTPTPKELGNNIVPHHAWSTWHEARP
jgi:hypothetical protein